MCASCRAVDYLRSGGMATTESAFPSPIWETIPNVSDDLADEKLPRDVLKPFVLSSYQ
jgi:hypothetical protein